MRRIFSIAASLSIIAVAAFIILKFVPRKNHEQLFAIYFKPYKDVISERSGRAGNLQEGMSLYNIGKYAEAIPYLTKQLAEAPEDAAIACYLGISYLATNRVTEAKQIFEKLSRDDNGLYREIAQWNLVLIYLKENENVRLENQLKDILNQKNHMYAAEAASLSEQL